MLLFGLILVLASIIATNGQYGQPLVGAVELFSFECRQIDIDVISSYDNKQYEVMAGKGFSYKCEFFVDTRDCLQTPQSSGCDGIEIYWIIPEQLANIERQKGNTRKIDKNMTIETNDGYRIYRNWFNITNIGVIHDGQYVWKFDLKFEMRTVFQNSFKITTIDLLQRGEPCIHDDSCDTNKCVDDVCDGDQSKPFPWLIVGISLGVVGIVLILIALVLHFVKSKHQLINRRFH